MMICFGEGPFNWEALNAIGTFLAVVVALGASWSAIRIPERTRENDRRDATAEVLKAATDSISIYRDAAELVSKNTWPDEEVTALRIRSHHQYQTLERLISRPALTGGGVAVGAGAMSIVATIRDIPTACETKRAIGAGPGVGARYVDAVGPARVAIEAAAAVVALVEDRARRVLAVANRSGRQTIPAPASQGAM
jgi:hypothetical protein